VPPIHHRGPTADEWYLLVSTNRGLEDVTVEDIDAIADAPAEVWYPGMVRASADEAAIYRLHARARSIHRVVVELTRGECDDLDGIYDLVRSLDVSAYLGPTQPFAVRAKRRGDHPFTSVDVEGEIGQAIIDECRSSERTRPPVDLDDPEVVFRVFVRGRTVTVGIDTTGLRSLHRRQYRVSEPRAPLRPTIAYAMYHYADLSPGERLLDPMCGAGTVPIEAAAAELRRPPTTGTAPALTQLRFLDPERYLSLLDSVSDGTLSCEIAGTDADGEAVASARENAAAAGLDSRLSFGTADATTTDIEADVVVTDLPFGIRTDGDLESLYAGFFDRLAAGDWRRLVVHTARPDLVPLAADRVVEMRRGRLEASILVVDR
jgi:23S rRNA G2445 N2-methylase RlmL